MCSSKPHAVCIPVPAEGHTKAMLQLAKLLHHNDGLPDSDEGATQDLNLLADSMTNNFLAPFVDLIKKLNNSSTSPVTCIVSDGFMPFTTPAAQQLVIPITLFFTFSASSSMGYMQYPALVEKGLAPLKGKEL
ncbi:hypothetical protein C1H46_045038 [Malus baccata]|uniref:Uncharacterized protein n=1 Tax=Malus baccata TaxID=106549 RepID=A0A540K5B7_MALBA|nr:hypothetical protein C1H46_045038 [Malus baccata]